MTEERRDKGQTREKKRLKGARRQGEEKRSSR